MAGVALLPVAHGPRQVAGRGLKRFALSDRMPVRPLARSSSFSVSPPCSPEGPRDPAEPVSLFALQLFDAAGADCR